MHDNGSLSLNLFSVEKYLLTLYHPSKLRVETLVVLAQHCSSCAVSVALVDGVERGNRGVGASVVTFRLLVGACLQGACHWNSVILMHL